MFASLCLQDSKSLLTTTPPKCLLSNISFDAYSTETDTPKNECNNEGGPAFKFPLDDLLSASESSGSKRNSLQGNEDRPSLLHTVDVSHLMLCHFGMELHDQHLHFNRAFSALQKIGADSGR